MFFFLGGGGRRLLYVGVVVVALSRVTAAAPSAYTRTRLPIDLRGRPHLSETTRNLRALLKSEFERWPSRLAGYEVSVSEFVSWDTRIVASVLASFGQILYSTGASMKRFTETINLCVDAEPSLRRNLAAAWSVVSAWSELQPVRHRIPTPLSVVRALISLAFLWSWTDMAVLIFCPLDAC